MGMHVSGSSKKQTTSSAKSPMVCSSTPLRSLFCLIACARGSIKIANKVGERQQPCLVNRPKVMLSVRLPFILILEYPLILLTALSLSPNFSSTWYRKVQLTPSKAFSAFLRTNSLTWNSKKLTIIDLGEEAAADFGINALCPRWTRRSSPSGRARWRLNNSLTNSMTDLPSFLLAPRKFWYYFFLNGSPDRQLCPASLCFLSPPPVAFLSSPNRPTPYQVFGLASQLC